MGGVKLLWRTVVRGAFKAAGLDSPYSAKEYGVNWSKQRKRCLERDAHTCRVCEIPADEMAREPAVHHITPRSAFEGTPREMNALDNLVTLCHACHGELEGEYTECGAEEFVAQAKRDNL